jgi:hypothetical protein
MMGGRGAPLKSLTIKRRTCHKPSRASPPSKTTPKKRVSIGARYHGQEMFFGWQRNVRSRQTLNQQGRSLSDPLGMHGARDRLLAEVALTFDDYGEVSVWALMLTRTVLPLAPPALISTVSLRAPGDLMVKSTTTVQESPSARTSVQVLLGSRLR